MSSENGWISMHRGWLHHPVFTQKEFCQRMAWYWLIENACWKTTRIRCGKKMIELQRGQLSYSIRYLASAWGWETTRVWRYINALQNETMIATDDATGQMVITICNYSKYQSDIKKMQQECNADSNANATANATNKNKDNNTTIPNSPNGLFGPDDLPPPAKDAANAKPKHRSRAAASFITDEFQPDFAGLNLAEQLGIETERTRREFVDYWKGVGKPMSDWQAVFRNRLRKIAQYRAERAQRPTGGGREPASVVDAALRAAARYSREN